MKRKRDFICEGMLPPPKQAREVMDRIWLEMSDELRSNPWVAELYRMANNAIDSALEYGDEEDGGAR